ncbi:MAG: class I SAM-dependent methyltransferase [Spirosomataceae bacterium]
MKNNVFDEFAEQYRSIHNANLNKTGFDSYYMSELKVRLIKGSTRRHVKRILDVGCGDGGMCVYFKQHFPDAHIVGIDISEKSIQIAQDRGLANCEFFVTDGHTLPFDDHSFDLVVVAGVLMHIQQEHQEAYIQEMHRVLMPKGRIAIFEHNPYNPVTRRLVKICPFDSEAVWNYPKVLKQKLTKAHFGDLQTHYYLFFPRFGLFSYFSDREKLLRRFPLGGQYFLSAQKIASKKHPSSLQKEVLNVEVV